MDTSLLEQLRTQVAHLEDLDTNEEDTSELIAQTDRISDTLDEIRTSLEEAPEPMELGEEGG